MKYYLYIRQSLKQKTNKDPSVSEIVKLVVVKLKMIWKKASIPIVPDQRIESMLKNYHGKYCNILKPLKGRQDSNTFSAKVKDFKSEAQCTLFDIAACKCVLLSKCSCPKDRKVPKAEHAFILDQRTHRKMAIGGVDLKTSKRTAAKIARKERIHKYLDASQKQKNQTVNTTLMEGLSSDCVSESDTQDEEEAYSAPSKSKRKFEEKDTNSQKKKRIHHLPMLAAACDRVGVSDRGAALIASSLLQDIGIVSNQDTSDIVYRNKVRRARQKKRLSFQSKRDLFRWV